MSEASIEIPQQEEKKRGCEEDEKCCLCLPIGCGIKTVGTLHIIGTFGYFSLASLLL